MLARVIYNAMLTNAAMYPSPVVTLVALLALITDLDAAQQAAGTKARGLAAVRNGKRDLLWTALEALRVYVQGLADSATPENAIAIIQTVGMAVAEIPTHTKPVLEAKLVPTPGVVRLIANATTLVGSSFSKVTFNWQWSGDGGKTWNQAASTPYAETEIPNLALMTTYAFRVCVTIGKVTGEWTQAVSILVR